MSLCWKNIAALLGTMAPQQESSTLDLGTADGPFDEHDIYAVSVTRDPG
jgi:hypothetical protein